MIGIADDPIIRCMEATGYPPWFGGYDDDSILYDEDFEEEDYDG